MTQALRGFKATGWLLGVVSLSFLVAFLVWAARGTSFSLIGILSASLQLATPILLGALSGVLCERSAVINIAIEGMMLGAGLHFRHRGQCHREHPAGPGCGPGRGGAPGRLARGHGHPFKVDQIMSGTVINIFATGLTSFLNQRVMQVYQSLNVQQTFPTLSHMVPALGKIPIIGPLLFDQGPIVWAALVLLVVIQVALFNTRWGLRTRAVGEHPRAADTVGIDVFRLRYLNVILGGWWRAWAGPISRWVPWDASTRR